MKHSFIKWAGTLVIVAVSLVVAIKTTFKGKITEEKFYVYSLPEYGYDLKHGKRVKVSFGLICKNKKDAEQASKKQDEILKIISSFLNKEDPSYFTDTAQYGKVKSRLVIELNRKLIPVEFISFVTAPRVL
ncbi:MAG: hypothetical protein JXA66_00675 [Oligoflexia bacterium]|nr:hypothetical protein [Oligoflexia bacterium]